jgi:drug/metabolite transporter (DMT)-like permease
VDDFGPILVLGSAASWALGSLVLRHQKRAGAHLTVAAFQMVIGGGTLALIGLVLGEADRLPTHITTGAAGAFLYLLIVGSLVGFVAFNWLLAHVSAAKVGTYAYVNPLIAVVIGWIAGEELTVWLVGGILIILTGVALVRSGEYRAQPDSAALEVSETAGDPAAAPEPLRGERRA